MKIVPIITGILAILTQSALSQSWSNAMLLNLPSESLQGAIKKPEVCSAAAGGFHITYRHHAGGTPMKYRRYLNGGLGPVRTAAVVPNYAWDQYICEAGNGDVHISWENWDATPNVGWTKSSDGGASFLPYVELTHFTGSAKAPRISPYGSGSDVLLVVADAANKTIWYNRYNGTSWFGAGSTGRSYGTEYQIFGICRSPLDGIVYAPSNADSGTVSLLSYNGNWSSTNLESPGFYARQSVAANAVGQIMLCYEKDSVWHSKLYSPGSGWGITQVVRSQAGFGSVIAIPGSNDFYSAYAQGGSPLRIRGKRFSGGTWGIEEVISAGLPDAQALDARVAIATDGSMLCCWEWWGNGNAEAWYSVRSSPTSSNPVGTLNGMVRDQFGAGVGGVSISTVLISTSSVPGGAYSAISPTGTYTVMASKPYYTGQTLSGVIINENQTATRDFALIGEPPAAVSSLAVMSTTTVNTLQWVNPTSPQFSATRIVYRTDREPTGPEDGTVFADDAALPGTTRSLSHTGLINGVMHHYAAYAYFQDASRFYAPAANGSGAPAVAPDMDHDGDVDQTDFGLFQGCYSGAFTPQTDLACRQARMDADSDVDEADAAIFMGCISGPGVPALWSCAG